MARASGKINEGTGWLERIEAEAARLLGGPIEGKRLERLGEALRGLHARFVREQPVDPGGPPYLSDKASLAAYLSYFVPASAAQVHRALVEVAPPAAKRWRVLDVGSGPGPALYAAYDWARAHGATVDATALEPSADALQVIARVWPGTTPVTTRVWKAGDPLPAGPFELILASHVLNELFLGEGSHLDRRTELVLDLASRLAPGGLLVLVEPALKRTGRELLVVRDRVLQKGYSALAPCLLQASCPAIARPRDWCHAERPWRAPPLVDRAGAAAGLERDTLKFSYVVLAKAHPAPERTKDQQLFRIVSEPLPEKGKRRYFGCGAAGRHPLVRLDRDASPTNAAFDALDRGDVLRVTGLVASGDGQRLAPGSELSVEVRASDRDGESK